MSRVFATAFFTFRELVRSRLLAVFFLAVVVLSFLAYLLAYLSYGDPIHIFMDLGLAGMQATGDLPDRDGTEGRLPPPHETADAG
jgi:hypothetical protein